ncbi:MAG: hypothetical protein KKC75_06000 [Nanoarchaeota archaeon]|nr:hypothetical protein [Nanoarchaeota archaeon]MBU1004698.1 hypothetical protein [Nanoarchaeota archaeon]MBU1945744.1 hypothetical protein [Nanoarchaeota archaeon]
MASDKTKKVKLNDKGEVSDGDDLETTVVREINLAGLGQSVADTTERATRKVADVQKDFDKVYEAQQKDVYSLDEVAMRDAPKGTTIYKVNAIRHELNAENVVDNLGIFLAKKHHRRLAKRLEDLKKKLEDEDYDSKKHEDESSIKEELATAREELKKLGFDWQAVKRYVGQRGLDDNLLSSIKDSYGKQAPSFEASRYLTQITEEHRPLVVEHLKQKHNPFVKYKLGDLTLDEIRQVFAQFYGLEGRHRGSDKADILERERHDAFKHLYRTGAAKPKLGEPTPYTAPKEYKQAA